MYGFALYIYHSDLITKTAQPKEVSILHLICHRLTVKCCFFSLKKGDDSNNSHVVFCIKK